MNDLERVLRLLFVLDEIKIHPALLYSYCNFGAYLVMYDTGYVKPYFFYYEEHVFRTNSIWDLSEKIIQQIDMKRREELL